MYLSKEPTEQRAQQVPALNIESKSKEEFKIVEGVSLFFIIRQKN